MHPRLYSPFVRNLPRYHAEGTPIPSPTTLEGVCYVLMLGLTLAYPPARRFLRSLPTGWAATLAALVALMVVGELLGRNRATFPFPAWDMYGQPPSVPLTHYRLVGVTAAGEEIVLNSGRLYPSLGLGTHRIGNLLAVDLARFVNGGLLTPETAALLTAVRDAHNRRSGPPVGAVRVVVIRVDRGEGDSGEITARTERVVDVPLD